MKIFILEKTRYTIFQYMSVDSVVSLATLLISACYNEDKLPKTGRNIALLVLTNCTTSNTKQIIGDLL